MGALINELERFSSHIKLSPQYKGAQIDKYVQFKKTVFGVFGLGMVRTFHKVGRMRIKSVQKFSSSLKKKVQRNEKTDYKIF